MSVPFVLIGGDGFGMRAASIAKLDDPGLEAAKVRDVEVV